MTATTTKTRTAIMFVLMMGIVLASFMQAPAAEASTRDATMGTTCSPGRIDSTVQVYGARNQWVATKYYVQKKIDGRWKTVYRTKYSQFQLTHTGRTDTSVGIRTKSYAVTVSQLGKYRVKALVWYWNASTRQWYGKTWVRPPVYNAYIGGRNTYLTTPYCRF